MLVPLLLFGAGIVAWTPVRLPLANHIDVRGTCRGGIHLTSPRRTVNLRLQQDIDDEQRANQVVAWFDELCMLQIVCMGDLEHDAGIDADTIEAAVAASGGNVSRELTPEERSLPDGSNPEVSSLAVSFSLALCDEAEGVIRLGVRFVQGYPLLGSLPNFELLADETAASQLPAGISAAVISAAEAAAQEKLAEGDGNVVYAAFGAAREALEAAGGDNSGAAAATATATAAATADSDYAVLGATLIGDRNGVDDAVGDASRAPADPGAGAWAVLGACGKPLHDVLRAWDSMRQGTASRASFRQAAQALAALGICERTPTNLELDGMYDALCDGQSALPLPRLLEPLNAAAGLIELRLKGIRTRTWREIDKWADETYNWYVASRELRRNPAAWRDAPNSRARNLFAADREKTTLHLFAAEDGSWGEDGHLVALVACALLVVDRQGRGAARLMQLSVSPAVAKRSSLESSDVSSKDAFEWEFRVLDAAELLAEQKGHLWCCVSAAEGTEWREALLARGYRPRQLPEDEPLAEGGWLIKATPLRERV